MKTRHAPIRQNGFTLVELAIMLVIIGLIVGGVLVGKDMIEQAGMTATITQIQKYKTAVGVFELKYDPFLPGDMPPTNAQKFGFTVGTGCDGTTAHRDGDGLLEGWPFAFANLMQLGGETSLFWTDLSTSGLIDGTFPGNGAVDVPCLGGIVPDLTLTPGTAYVGDYFPAARIGRGNFIYVYSNNGDNYYGLSAISAVSTISGQSGIILSTPTITVAQAYAIDQKIDDGFPLTGKVIAAYLNNDSGNVQSPPNAAFDSAATCFNTTGSGSYSIGYNGGSNPNCALSFQF